MTTPADIFEALAQLPDRTPAQRSAAILRASDQMRAERGIVHEEDWWAR